MGLLLGHRKLPTSWFYITRFLMDESMHRLYWKREQWSKHLTLLQEFCQWYVYKQWRMDRYLSIAEYQLVSPMICS